MGLAKAVWDEEQAAGANGAKSKGKKELTAKQKALKEKIDGIGLGGVSFFAWFGFRGEPVTAEESKIAVREERDRRKRRAGGEEVPTPEPSEDGEQDLEDLDEDLEIFPMGEQLALAISDDLWTGALKYFSKWRRFPP